MVYQFNEVAAIQLKVSQNWDDNALFVESLRETSVVKFIS
jgi:hypothetical protein